MEKEVDFGEGGAPYRLIDYPQSPSCAAFVAEPSLSIS